MHTAIGVTVVVDLENENVFVYDDNLMNPMKENDAAHDGFEKDLGVDKAVDCTSAGIEVDM